VAVTLGISIGALFCGLALGIFFAIKKNTFGLLTLLRSVPELFLLFLFYFGGTALLTQVFSAPIEVSPWVAGILALSLVFGAYSAQVFRMAFARIPEGQQEVAKTLGLSKTHILIRIIFPQVWRYALPGLGNLWLVLLKDSSLVALIGAADLMNAAQLAASHTKQPFLFYMVAAGLYLIITSLSMFVLRKAEKKWI
jgi:ABC-type arginine transport system permease subunit